MNGVCSILTCNWDNLEVYKVKFLGDNMFQRVDMKSMKRREIMKCVIF